MNKIFLETSDNFNLKNIPWNQVYSSYLIPKHLDDTFEKYLLKHPDKDNNTYRRKHYNIVMDMICGRNTFRKKYNHYKEHIILHQDQFIKTLYIINERCNKYDLINAEDTLVFIYEDKPATNFKLCKNFKDNCTYNLTDNFLYTFQNTKLNLSDAINEVYNIDDPFKTLTNLIKLVRFNNNKYANQGSNVRRIFSSFTDLPSDTRKYLSLNGLPFHSFDIQAAQPTLLPLILSKYNLPIDDNYIESSGTIYENIMLASKCAGYTYEKVSEKINNQYTGKRITYYFNKRDDVKTLLFRSIYFGQKEATQSITAKLFQALYPITFDSLHKLKDILKEKDSNHTIAAEAQNMEADIMFNQMPNCPYFTVHDSIYVTDKQEGELFCKRITDKFKDIVDIKWHYTYEDIPINTKPNTNIITINCPKRKPHKKHNASSKSILIKEYFSEYVKEGLSRIEIMARLNISESYYYELKRKLKNYVNKVNSTTKDDNYIKSKEEMVVLFKDQYLELLDRINIEDFILHPIYLNKKHLKNNTISILYFFFINSEIEYILPIHHYDKIYDINLPDIINAIYNSTGTKYILNKKQLLYKFPKIKNIIDVELCNYLYRLNIEFISDKYQKLNTFIYPIIKHLENCQDIKNKIIDNIEVFNKIVKTKPYKFYSDKALPAFYLIENSGLNINRELFKELFPEKQNHLNDKNNLIYSQYNFYTTTGRPSNTFANFNFAALKKSDETRSIFTSRYNNGKLIEFDYSAFHPHLILNLIDYEIDEDNIYKHLAKYFYDNPTYSSEEHDEVKKLTFQLLYGEITEDFKIIPFFEKTSIYINSIWNEYKTKGYIKSPYSERIIHKKFFKDDKDFNKNKLWNYLIQLLETEHNILVIKDILKLLQSKHFKSKLVLYTYDSFLFDYSIEDNEQELLKDLNNIITKQNKFPVTIKTGINYKVMNIN